MNRIALSLLTLGLSLAPILCWAAEPNSDEANAIAEIKKIGGMVTDKSVNVSLGGFKVTDAGLENLKALTKLRSLSIFSNNVSDAGLAHLKDLTQLQSLTLWSTQVTDAGLEHLKGLTNLQSLYLNLPKATDAGLEHLQGLTKLQSLKLFGNWVTDAGVKHLKGFIQLQELSLWKAKVSDAGLEHLKGLTQLQSLSLAETQVTGAGLANLEGLTELKSLILMNTQVSDTGLEHLKGLAKLQYLNLENTQVSDAGLEHLKGLAKLELQTLYLRNTQVTDTGIRDLQKALGTYSVVPRKRIGVPFARSFYFTVKPGGQLVVMDGHVYCWRRKAAPVKPSAAPGQSKHHSLPNEIDVAYIGFEKPAGPSQKAGQVVDLELATFGVSATTLNGVGKDGQAFSLQVPPTQNPNDTIYLATDEKGQVIAAAERNKRSKWQVIRDAEGWPGWGGRDDVITVLSFRALAGSGEGRFVGLAEKPRVVKDVNGIEVESFPLVLTDEKHAAKFAYNDYSGK